MFRVRDALGIARGAKQPGNARGGHRREEVLEVDPEHDRAMDRDNVAIPALLALIYRLCEFSG